MLSQIAGLIMDLMHHGWSSCSGQSFTAQHSKCLDDDHWKTAGSHLIATSLLHKPSQSQTRLNVFNGVVNVKSFKS